MPLPQRHFLCLLTCLLLTPAFAQQPDLSIVERWMATNSGVRTLRIDFTQTRTMRSLKVPIKQPGSLWLDYATGRFRWQTGEPPATIVVRPDRDLFIIRVGSQKYERRPAGSESTSPGMGALASGFPRSMDDFMRKYRVLNIQSDPHVHRISTKPLGQAGRGVETFMFVVGRDDYRLRGIEIRLEDGSSLDTVFDRVYPNVPLPNGLFTPDITGFKETKF